MEILRMHKETENPLMKRKEVEFYVKSETAPSYLDALSFIAKHFSTSPETIRIKRINGKFGSRNFLVSANVYHSEKDLDNTESFSKKEKEKMNKLNKPVAEAVPAQ